MTQLFKDIQSIVYNIWPKYRL